MALALLFAAPAAAEERFPPPDFSGTKYQVPETQFAPWRASFMGYVDVAVLAGALALGVYFAYARRSRRGLFWLAAFSVLYFGFYRGGCVCPIGAIQNVTLAAANPAYHLPLTVAIFFALPLLLALVCGRIFCGAVCPLGTLQELLLLQPVKVPKPLEHGLGLIPYAYLGLAVVYAALNSGFIICEYDPFVGFFRMNGPFGMLVFGAALLALGVFIGRPYCRFLCPYGALLRLLAPLGAWQVHTYPTTCVQCRLCEEACPYGAIVPMTPPVPAAKRLAGRGALVATLALLPVLIALLALLGYSSGGGVARLNNRVALHNMLAQTGGSRLDDRRVEVEAFLKTGVTEAALAQESAEIVSRFRVGGAWLGAWIGLVLGLKLAALSVRRRRVNYEPDPALCVACARCYEHCPQQHAWLGEIGQAGDRRPEAVGTTTTASGGR